jgi:hypothetical protein
MNVFLVLSVAQSAEVVPTDIQQPGTQPGEVGALESPEKCDNCHGNSSKGVELSHEWGGSMMAHASRDPLFWATMAVSEQTFDGSGDLCLRCHTTTAWMAGRSTPTDGSGLQAQDADGVDCHFCHAMTNPDDSELVGEQDAPFIAQWTSAALVMMFRIPQSAISRITMAPSMERQLSSRVGFPDLRWKGRLRSIISPINTASRNEPSVNTNRVRWCRPGFLIF